MSDSRTFDAPGRALSRMAAWFPLAACSAAALLGAIRNRIVRRWPSPAEVQTLFPERTARECDAIARRIGSLFERNRVFARSILQTGGSVARGLLPAEQTNLLPHGPAILVTFHVGAVHALGAALERLEGPVVAFRAGRLFEPRTSSLTIESTEGDRRERAAALHRALEVLRRGGIVLLALDVVPEEGIDTRCLGRTLRLAPGAFALARWSGAPIIPIAARWQRGRVCIEVGESVATPDEAAAWLEGYLTQSPAETSLELLRMLLAAS